MISRYEVHITTKHTLFEILEELQSKGLGINYMMAGDDCYDTLVVKTSDGKTHHFSFKFAWHEGDEYVYEIGSIHKECLPLMEEIAQTLN